MHTHFADLPYAAMPDITSDSEPEPGAEPQAQ